MKRRPRQASSVPDQLDLQRELTGAMGRTLKMLQFSSWAKDKQEKHQGHAQQICTNEHIVIQEKLLERVEDSVQLSQLVQTTTSLSRKEKHRYE